MAAFTLCWISFICCARLTISWPVMFPASSMNSRISKMPPLLLPLISFVIVAAAVDFNDGLLWFCCGSFFVVFFVFSSFVFIFCSTYESGSTPLPTASSCSSSSSSSFSRFDRPICTSNALILSRNISAVSKYDFHAPSALEGLALSIFVSSSTVPLLVTKNSLVCIIFPGENATAL